MPYLRTVASFEAGLIGGPAALLLVQPERLRAYAELQVGHPTGSYVYNARCGSGK